jgi:hypothetical protein
VRFVSVLAEVMDRPSEYQSMLIAHINPVQAPRSKG